MTRRQPRQQRTFWGDFKTFFVRGLGILLPSILTLWLLWQASVFLLGTVAEPINKGVRGIVVWVIPNVVPDEQLPDWFRVDEGDVAAFRNSAAGRELESSLGETPSDTEIREAVRRSRLATVWGKADVLGFQLLDAVGLLIAIVLLYLAGALLGGFIGRRIYGKLESLLARLPGFKQIYPHIKQLVELVLGDRPMAFRRTVLVEYPGKGIWTVGFVTGDSLIPVSEVIGSPSVAVFIPTSPTPMTGFTINVPESSVRDLELTIDEALRYVITAGVLIPDRHKPLASAQAPLPAAGASSGVETDPDSSSALGDGAEDRGSKPV